MTKNLKSLLLEEKVLRNEADEVAAEKQVSGVDLCEAEAPTEAATEAGG